MDKLGKYLKKYERISSSIIQSNIHPTHKALLILFAIFAFSITLLGHSGSELVAYLILTAVTILISLLLLLHGYYTKKTGKDKLGN